MKVNNSTTSLKQGKNDIMKSISTTIATGQRILYEGQEATVGTYKKGEIQIQVSISPTSGYSLFLSTRKVNQLIQQGKITTP